MARVPAARPWRSARLCHSRSKLAGQRPRSRHCCNGVDPASVEIWHERALVARHERSFGRYQQVLDLEHYLDVLERKQSSEIMRPRRDGANPPLPRGRQPRF